MMKPQCSVSMKRWPACWPRAAAIRDRGGRYLRCQRPGVGARPDVRHRCAAARQFVDGWLRGASCRPALCGRAPARRSTHPGRQRGALARTRFGGAHLHRRAGSCGCRCGGDAGVVRARWRRGDRQSSSACWRSDQVARRGYLHRAGDPFGRHPDQARRVRSACLGGACAGTGIPTLQGRRVFSTGDELAMPGEPLRDGAIYNPTAMCCAAC